jgi:type VI secretion system secreted protein Hcp
MDVEAHFNHRRRMTVSADMFLKLEGPVVNGESQDSVHKDLIEITGFNWGVNNMGTAGVGGGGGSGGANKQDLIITKQVDKASNVLMVGCASGTHYTKATVYVRKAGGDALDYLTIEMGPGDKGAVFLSGFVVSGLDNTGQIPSEQVTINFSTLNMIYNQQAKQGTGAGAAPLGWDFGAKKKM